MPYHRARKIIPFLDERGRTVKPEEPNGVKFEMFVFDALRFARDAMVMEVDRAAEFAPVKNPTGKDSVVTARRALSEQYAGWLEAAGMKVTREADGSVAGAVEVGPLTADSAQVFVKALKGGRLPHDIEFRDGLAI
jgi:UDP-N-acetylglucosamine/UDP-N-acetylgalactosamine diphosphorylase